MYIENHPVLPQDHRKEVTFSFNGTKMKAKQGQTIAAALIMNGTKKLGITRKLQKSRGLFCATGRCCSCFVTVDGLDHVLSCMTPVEDGMEVTPANVDPDVRRADYGN